MKDKFIAWFKAQDTSVQKAVVAFAAVFFFGIVGTVFGFFFG